MELYYTLPQRLDKFIHDNLQPSTLFLDQVTIAMDNISRFLREYSFQQSVQVIRTVEGGSYGKGTAFKKGSDANLVVFLSHFQSFEDQNNERAEMLKKIHEALLHYQREHSRPFVTMSTPILYVESSWLHMLTFGLFTPKSLLRFQIKSQNGFDAIDFDVHPAFDALGQSVHPRPDPERYVKLINLNASQGDFWLSLTELRRDFVKNSPPKLKSVIRLVKYWYKEFVCRLHSHKLNSGDFFPKPYALELLIIYAWESTSQGQNINIPEGFRTLLELVVRYRELWLYWTEYYDFSHPELKKYLTRKLLGPKPIILDPTDPTRNMVGSARWDLVAMEAERCLQQNCVQGVVSWHVEPVKRISVTVIPPSGISIYIDSFSISPFSSITTIKDAIWRNTGLLLNNFHLHLGEQILEESQSLAFYGIVTKVTLYLKDFSSCSLL